MKGFIPRAMACGHHARNHTWEAGSAPHPTYRLDRLETIGTPNRAMDVAA